MNVVLIIPTGIGADIGGHAGDANPVAKLLASTCDRLITHPNVVNASDINEMTENTWYVEGSILDRFLEGAIYLKQYPYNRVLVVANNPVGQQIVNSVSAARATLGSDMRIVELITPLRMVGRIERGLATGDVHGWQEVCEQVQQYQFDALAITSIVEIEEETKQSYLRSEAGVNPWGAVEALASRLIATQIDKPVAHAPFAPDEVFEEIVEPRKAAEIVSVSYLHCVLKGLHRAPRIDLNSGLSIDDIDVLVSPINCVGRPHQACMKAGVPVIAVRENKTVLNDPMPDNFIIVDNYLEAAGVIMAMRAGVHHPTVRRPLKNTELIQS